MQATKQDVQVINGIEYPYISINGNPVRVICQDYQEKQYPVVILELTEDGEVLLTLTDCLLIFYDSVKPYIKPYVKPSIFDGMKPGTVVFIRETNWSSTSWQAVCFDKETSDVVVSRTGFKYDKSRFEFRLDNPYLAESEAPVEKPWIEWNGGEMPVKKGTKVDVKYEDGHIERSISAGEFDPNSISHIATNWDSGLGDSTIVAYRLA